MHSQTGVTLVELLVALVIVAVLGAAAGSVLASQTRLYRQQELVTARQQNLRMAVDTLAYSLRNTRYGVPPLGLNTWIPWVSGFNANPTISATAPHVVSVAACTPLPLARLAAPAAAGDTDLIVVSDVAGMGISQLLDTNQRRLILLGDDASAHVVSVQPTGIQIDTDLARGSAQGLARGYPAGTPLCRVDVLTFFLAETTPGLWGLMVDRNQGSGAQPLAEGITNLQVSAIDAVKKSHRSAVDDGRRYQLTLTGQVESIDPLTGSVLPTTIRSVVLLRNGR